MQGIRPLLYLNYRIFVNGILRSLKSPKRLVVLLATFGYYFLIFIRPNLDRENSSSRLVQGKIDLPPLELIDALVFTGFSLLTLLMLGGISITFASFRPADVDVLFPTPISPKLVLVFKIIRDYFFTLLLPFVFILLGFGAFKPGWESIFRNMPNKEYSGLTLKFGYIAWILLSLMLISINYAVSLSVNRSDVRSDRNRKIMNVSVVLGFLSLASYFILNIVGITSLQQFVDFLNQTLTRVLLLPSTLATKFVLSGVRAEFIDGLIGAGGLLLIAAIAFAVALSKTSWMYDQAAVRGFKHSTNIELRKSGDMYGQLAVQAKEGKLKAGKSRWMFRLRWQGAKALLWRELILQVRGVRLMWILMFFFTGMMNLPIFLRDTGKLPLEIFVVLMQTVSAFMLTMMLGTTGFLEVLKRVDLQKPLPFNPSTTVYFEVLSKGILSALPASIFAIIVPIFKPHLWATALSCLALTPAIAILISATMFLITILFPDYEDPTQRNFRGMMLMLAVAVCLFAPGALFLLIFFTTKMIAVASLVAAGVSIGISYALSIISGNLYAGYNPTE